MSEQTHELGARRKETETRNNSTTSQQVRNINNPNPATRNNPAARNMKMSQRNDNAESRRPLDIVNTCPIDVMSDAKRKVGIKPITEEDIRNWIEDDESRENDSRDKVFKGSSNHVARMNAALTFLEDKLRIPLSEIRIKDVKMCRNPEKQILWIESDERFVKRAFYKSSILQDKSINVIQYTPMKHLREKL